MKLNINGNSINVDLAALSKAVEDGAESFDISSDDLVVKSKSDFETLISNTKKEAGDYQVEIGRKEVLKGLGIETEGGLHKDLSKSIEAITGYTKSQIEKAIQESGAEPNGKIKELQSDIEKLQSIISEKDTKIQESINTFNTYKKDQTIKEVYSKYIPENTILPKSDIALILSNKIKLDVNEDGNVFGIGQDGNPIKDENLSLMGPDKLIQGFFNDNPSYIKSAEGGKGEGDSSSSGKMTYSQLVKQQAEKGNNPMSEEFKAELNRLNSEGSIDLDA